METKYTFCTFYIPNPFMIWIHRYLTCNFCTFFVKKLLSELYSIHLKLYVTGHINFHMRKLYEIGVILEAKGM
jgi:hypothetical protein